MLEHDFVGFKDVERKPQKIPDSLWRSRAIRKRGFNVDELLCDPELVEGELSNYQSANNRSTSRATNSR